MDKKIWLPQHRGGMTRRGFLRRVGMGATALALSNGGFLVRRPTRALAASMLPGGVPVDERLPNHREQRPGTAARWRQLVWV